MLPLIFNVPWSWSIGHTALPSLYREGSKNFLSSLKMTLKSKMLQNRIWSVVGRGAASATQRVLECRLILSIRFSQATSLLFQAHKKDQSTSVETLAIFVWYNRNYHLQFPFWNHSYSGFCFFFLCKYAHLELIMLVMIVWRPLLPSRGRPQQGLFATWPPDQCHWWHLGHVSTSSWPINQLTSCSMSLFLPASIHHSGDVAALVHLLNIWCTLQHSFTYNMHFIPTLWTLTPHA